MNQLHPHGLYIHIPFCLSKCPYCDFYSLPGDAEMMDAYTALLCNMIEAQAYIHQVDTIYFGGGTPTLMGARRLSRIMEACQRHLKVLPGAEVSLEANPGDEMAALLPELLHAGFTRVSFGVQSLRDCELSALGRRHTARQAVDCIELAAGVGFENISADLMLAIPHQTVESLTESIHSLCALPLSHISAYLLKVEEGTPFATTNSACLLPDDDLTAQLYLDCVERLQTQGFSQYEISNFAHLGQESRHNLKYWRCQEYLGLGPSAHSYVNGCRFYFPQSLVEMLKTSDPFALSIPDGDGGGFEEWAMLRLRLREGLDLEEMQNLYSNDPAPLWKRAIELEKHGLVHLHQNRVHLTPQGFLLSSAITGELLYGR